LIFDVLLPLDNCVPKFVGLGLDVLRGDPEWSSFEVWPAGLDFGVCFWSGLWVWLRLLWLDLVLLVLSEPLRRASVSDGISINNCSNKDLGPVEWCWVLLLRAT
jgi:hypothetical protein